MSDESPGMMENEYMTEVARLQIDLEFVTEELEKKKSTLVSLEDGIRQKKVDIKLKKEAMQNRKPKPTEINYTYQVADDKKKLKEYTTTCVERF